MRRPARSLGWRSAGAFLVLAGILAGSPTAEAVDWQVVYRLTEALRVSDNIELREDPEGAALSSHSGAGLDIAARTPTLDWDLSGDIGRLLFFGEGAPEDRKRTTIVATSDLVKRTVSTDFNLNAHFSMAPAAGVVLADPLLPLPELGDLGLELVNFDRIRYGAGAGFFHRWTRRDDLEVSATAERVDFTGDALTAIPHTFAELSGVWTRHLTRRVDGRVQASAGHFRSDGNDDLQRLIYNFVLGSNFRATRRLTVDANAGVAVIDQRLADTGGVRRSDVSADFIGDISLTYTPWRDTSMTLALSRQVTPDTLGDLRTVQAVRGAVAYRINDRSSFSLTGAFTDSAPAGDGGDSRQAWTLSPSYTRALTRYWDVTLGYRWLKSNVARSNTAFVTLSHRGTLLP